MQFSNVLISLALAFALASAGQARPFLDKRVSQRRDTGNTTDSGAPGDFALANGQEAQQLNTKFAQLTPDSPCTDGDQACINEEFAHCSGSQFVLSSCDGTLQCFALPLVDKSGISITCDTLEDALARIAATGATGGITGSNDTSTSTTATSTTATSTTDTSTSTDTSTTDTSTTATSTATSTTDTSTTATSTATSTTDTSITAASTEFVTVSTVFLTPSPSIITTVTVGGPSTTTTVHFSIVTTTIAIGGTPTPVQCECTGCDVGDETCQCVLCTEL